MRFGDAMRESVTEDIKRAKAAQAIRAEHIDRGDYDLDDCFVSVRLDETSVRASEMKLEILDAGGVSWFVEFSTLDGTICPHHTARTRYGYKDVVETPGGDVWVGSRAKGPLAKKGLKLVRCLRPAWVSLRSSYSGLYGAAMASPVVFPSEYNYLTGERAGAAPLEVADID